MPENRQIVQTPVPEGVIDLGMGQPSEDLLPIKELALAAKNSLKESNRLVLQYGMQQGSSRFRETLAGFLSESYDTKISPKELFITAGTSQAIDMLCSTLTRPGDTIFVEEPTYFLALRIFKDYQLNIVTLPMDHNGIDMEVLEEKLKKSVPVFLYTVPVFHNPSSVTLSANRRRHLIKLSHQYRFQVVADEPYQMLQYTNTPPPPLATGDTGRSVLSLGTFSKILAPGLRLGWIQADPYLFRSFLQSGTLVNGGGLNPMVSSIVDSFIKLGLQSNHLNHLIQTYRRRLEALCRALNETIPNLEYVKPQGGYFVWARLPEGIDAKELFKKAKKEKVRFQPGIRFSGRGKCRGYMRLCFAHYREAAIIEGVERIARAITGTV